MMDNPIEKVGNEEIAKRLFNKILIRISQFSKLEMVEKIEESNNLEKEIVETLDAKDHSHALEVEGLRETIEALDKKIKSIYEHIVNG